MINMSFMNLPKKFNNKEKSKVIITPIEYDGYVTTGSGANKGPKEIIKASYELEYFDCELNIEPYLAGIHTTKSIIVKKDTENNFHKDSQEMLDRLSKLSISNKFIIFLGSDHSTTFPIINYLEKENPDFGIIVFDAHSDLREPLGKETWWHACVSRLISKKHKTLIAGVRSQDFYEKEYLKTSDSNNLEIILANDLKKSQNNFNLELKNLPKKIFISIDVDFFDPSIIRNTNTPEPGGFDWFEINNLLQEVFTRKEVIGVDIVEFAPKGPLWNYKGEGYMLAKLVYKIIAYKFK